MSVPRRELLQAAEQAVGQGRLGQAVRLLSGEAIHDVSGRRLAIDLHDQLVARCRLSIQSSAWIIAIDHLQWLRDLEGESEAWTRLRAELQVASREWAIASAKSERYEAIESLHAAAMQAHIDLPFIANLNSDISSIRSAKKLAALGRFAEAESCLRVQVGPAGSALGSTPESELMQAEAKRLDVEHAKAKKLTAEMHQALEAKDWNSVVNLSEQLLGVSNRHPMALQMRQRAITELAAQGKNTRKFMEPRNQMALAMPHPSTHAESSSLDRDRQAESRPRLPVLWIDGVGGYALCDSVEALIGQAVPGNPIELMIVGDLSRRAAAIRRSGEDHLLQPLQNVLVNRIKIERAALLRDGDLISIGPRVELKYTRPNKLSATAKLEIVSRHRWQPSVDGVLLMGDTCILGPSSTSHVLCPYWSSDLILFRNRDQWMCKCSQPLEIDGKEHRDAVALIPGKRVRGPDFSFALE